MTFRVRPIVIQQRHPDTQEPLGQYFVIFSTYTAALAYEQNLRHLHRLSRHALPDAYKAKAGVSEGLPPAEDNEVLAASLRAFTVFPPSATPRLRLYSAKHLSKAIRDLEKEQQQRREVTGRARDAFYAGQIRAAKDIQRVLEKLDSGEVEAGIGECKVLLRLEGGKTAVEIVRAAVERNGEERNLAWRLDERDDAIKPLESSGGKGRPAIQDNEGEENLVGVQSESLFGRFVVSFAEAAEARRFVRVWHRRELWDERTGRMIVINATVLW